MATITPPFRYTEGGAHPTAHGDNTATDNINDWLEGAAIANLDQTNFNTDNVDGNAAVASLRTLGTGSVNACAGNDARLSDARSANAIVNDASYPIATTAPSVGDVLTFDGANYTPAASGAGAAFTGTGTVDTAGAAPGPADDQLVANGGAGTAFLSELNVGDLVIVDTGDTRRIVAVADNFNATVDQVWATTVSNKTFQIIRGSRPRPFDRTQSKSANFSITSGDAGSTFLCDCSGGDVVGTLPSAALFRDGDTVTIIKITDDINSAQLSPDGTDTIDGVNSSYAIWTINGMVTIQRTGSGSWRIVSERYRSTTVLQSVSTTDTTQPAAFTTTVGGGAGDYIPFDSTIPQIDEGAEIINVSITPIASNSVLRIRAQLQIAVANSDSNTDFIAAVFQDAAANTAASVTILHGMDKDFNKNQVIHILAEIPSPGAATTISIRGSRTNNGDWYLNNTKDNQGFFGGTMTSFIEVQEIAA